VTLSLTVLVVAYNAAHRIEKCLDPLVSTAPEGVEVEIVVIDNASADGTAQLVEQRYPSVRLLRSPVNLGFAAGNNLGVRESTGEWVVLVNDDAAPEPGFLRAIAEAASTADPHVGAIAATVLLSGRFRRPDTSPGHGAVIEAAAGDLVADAEGDIVLVNSTGNVVRVDGYGVDRGWLEDAATHVPSPDVFGFSGAAAALRRAALDDVGLFDSSFFMYYEDTDLSWRMRLAVWSVLHCPGAVVHHDHSASSVEGSTFFEFHDQRNRLLTLLKNATALLAVRAISRYLITTASIVVRRSQPGARIAVRFRVVLSVTARSPGVLNRRLRGRRFRRVPRKQVEGLLAPLPARPSGTYRSR